MPVNDYILLRKGSSTEWSNANPVLASGEPGYDITNNILKVGDGTKSWNNLEPINTALNNFNIYGTGNIDISGNITANTGNFDVISFNVDNESILTKGQISWDDTEGTMDIGLTDNTTIHIGEHRYFRVRNETGDTLHKGQPVYATGVHNNGLISPDLYVADGSVREVRFMGLVLEDVNNQNNGYVVDFGHLEEMDLDGSAANYAVGDETWNAGDILYVHPTVAGKLTNVEPKHSISVAIVLDPGNGNGNGRMFVRPTSYGHLDDNHDVAVSGATSGQFLQYNSASGLWLASSSGNFSTLSVNGTGVSLSGHTHTNSDITNWNEAVDDRVNDLLVGISGINISYNDSSNIINIAYTGSSGGGGGVVINNYSDNRLLTSDGTSTGIDAESGLIFLSNGNKLGIGTTDPYGNLGLSNGYFNITGDSQKSSLTVRNSTSDNSSTTLYADGISEKLVLPISGIWNFNINLACFSSTNEGAAGWNFRGCIKRNSSTTSLVGSLIEENFIDSSLNGVAAAVVANTGTHSLDINVNGLNSNNILWTAGVDLVQTIYSGVASSPTPTPSVTTTPTITPTITPTVTNTTTPTTTPTVTTTTTNTPTVTNTTTQTPTPTVTPTTTPPYMGGQKYNFIP